MTEKETTENTLNKNEPAEKEESQSLFQRFIRNPIRAILGLEEPVSGAIHAGNGLVDMATGNFSRGGKTILQGGKQIISTPINMASNLIKGENYIDTTVEYEKGPDGKTSGTFVSDTISNVLEGSSDIIGGSVLIAFSPLNLGALDIKETATGLTKGGKIIANGIATSVDSLIPTLKDNSEPVKEQTPDTTQINKQQEKE